MPINQEAFIHQNIICANIFVRKGDKYLVLRRWKKKKFAAGVVHPIGGKVDQGENPYLAAKREVLEEAGIEVKNMRLEAVILEINPPDALPVITWPLAEVSPVTLLGLSKLTLVIVFIIINYFIIFLCYIWKKKDYFILLLW